MSDLNSVTLKFKDKKTAQLSEEIAKHIDASNRKDQIFVASQKTVILFILGMKEHIDFAQTPLVTLGRFDVSTQATNLFDLRQYGAAERGVSRVHCELELKDNQLVITDLDSSNGTYVSGKRLHPRQPYILKKGEELALGRLPIQIMSQSS